MKYKYFRMPTFLENIYKVGKILSAWLFNYNNKLYIIASNNSNNYISFFKHSFIKVYDLEGKIIKELNDSCDRTYFIDTFYDQKLDKNYIISCNKNDINLLTLMKINYIINIAFQILIIIVMK